MPEPSMTQLTRRQVIASSALVAVALAAGAQSGSAQPEIKAPERDQFTVSRDELKAWTVDFVGGLKAGKALVNCLTDCAARTNNEYLKQITNNILAILEMGYTLSGAMELNHTVFDRNYATTVRYGEIYGILDETLEKMLREWDHLH